MPVILRSIALLLLLIATGASAQGVNLSGVWRCVAMCIGRQRSLAVITQNGWQLNVVDLTAGVASRGWVEYPGRIWIERADQGAVYSADGLTIHFDRGTIWKRTRRR